MILGTGFILSLVSLYFKALVMAVMTLLGVVGYISLDLYMFVEKGIWINVVFPVFTQLFVYSGITVYRFTFEEREKRFIKGAFSQYLAPAVVNQLVGDPNLLKLGGERKVLTAFFSDVARFSTRSEKLTPEELVLLLNEYLSEMTDIIMKYEGTVDKFEGDAIIAFFGAPIPQEDHARRACLATLDMQKRCNEMRKTWREQGKHELFMRIGLNTGPMVVGNMGSKTRMDYTMMGDSVNLAARLEGVNKQYGTYDMFSEFTYEHVKDEVEVRELDLIRVVGKSEPVRIYQLLCRKGELDEKMSKIIDLYAKGLEHYRKQEWDDALDSFGEVLEIDEKDGPSLTFFERCLLFQKESPPADWDGVFSMKTK
jgi:adenylate cyclase